MDYDFLEFAIDATAKGRVSGEEDWEQRSFVIAAGNHTLRWRYAKDSSTSVGQDRGWLDEVVFVPDSGPPVVIAQPASQTVGLGDTVTFTAGVGGATPRRYQWFFDECYAIPGATNLSLTRSNVSLPAAGYYRLVVSNALGTAVSSNAVLSVTTNGPVTNVLLFTDQGSASPYRTALNNLGRAHTLFSDFVAFNNAVSNADSASTLVIVDAPLANAPFNAAGRFANAGGRALLQYWGMDLGSALAGAFNASVALVLTTPEPTTPIPVYNWGGSGFFQGLSSPVSFVGSLVYDGQKLQPTTGGRAVAGWTSAVTVNQAAIVVGHSGRTILNGCLLEEASNASARVRLAQNEIEYLLAVRTPRLLSPSWVGGQFQVMLEGTPGATYSLRGSSDLTQWTTVSNVTLSANPILITVPAAADWSFYQAVTPPVP
jgi:hypothetical protein